MDAAARLKRKRTREKMSRVVAQNFDDISEGDLSELAEMMKQKWPKSLTSDYLLSRFSATNSTRQNVMSVARQNVPLLRLALLLLRGPSPPFGS